MFINFIGNPYSTIHSLIGINRNISISVNKISTLEKNFFENPSGMSISNSLDYQIVGLNAAFVNVSQAKSLLSIADNALISIGGNADEFGGILKKIKDKANEAAISSTTSERRTELNSEAQKLLLYIDNIVSKTTFNGINLLDSSLTSSPVRYQVGVSKDNTINLTIGDVRKDSLFVNNLNVPTSIDLSTEADAGDALIIINNAISNFKNVRNQVDGYIVHLDIITANIESSIDRYKDASSIYKAVDLNREKSYLNDLLNQQKASTWALAQLNNAKENMLKLLF